MTSARSVPGANNLDLIRFALAAIVFMSHVHALSGAALPACLPGVRSSTFAIQAFFAISGFLIFQSYDRSASLRSYAIKRARRILPAYLFVVTACALLLGLLSSLHYDAYLAHPGFVRYLAANLAFLNFLAPELPGVFRHNPLVAVNGALWTLKIEVAFYIAVPLCVRLFDRVGLKRALSGLYLASAAYGAALAPLSEAHPGGLFPELSRQLPGQMTYFVAGGAIYYHFGRFCTRRAAMFCLGLAIFILSQTLLDVLLRPAGVALMVLAAAFGPYLGRFARYGDLSYGIYIVHFPLVQVLVSLGLPHHSPAVFLLAAVAVVIGTAFALWHLLENRFLRRDSHYRREATTG